jgi:hypothetical protein
VGIATFSFDRAALPAEEVTSPCVDEYCTPPRGWQKCPPPHPPLHLPPLPQLRQLPPASHGRPAGLRRPTVAGTPR